MRSLSKQQRHLFHSSPKADKYSQHFKKIKKMKGTKILFKNKSLKIANDFLIKSEQLYKTLNNDPTTISLKCHILRAKLYYDPKQRESIKLEFKKIVSTSKNKAKIIHKLSYLLKNTSNTITPAKAHSVSITPVKDLPFSASITPIKTPQDAFSGEGGLWQKTKLQKGVNFYKFDGEMPVTDAQNQSSVRQQSIRVIRVAKKQFDNLRVIRSEDYLKQAHKKKIRLTEIPKHEPDLLFLINGGFFHYKSKTTNPAYEFEGDYTEGDLIGTCIVDGKEYSSNPSDPLWGVFSTNQDGAEIANTPLPNANFALGCAPILVKNGQVTPLDTMKFPRPKVGFCPPGNLSHITAREPRTAIAMREKDILFVTVDGRRKDATGMDGIELANFLKSHGSIHALNLDGGGSTQMWIKGMGAVNTSSDTNIRALWSSIGFRINPK